MLKLCEKERSFKRFVAFSVYSILSVFPSKPKLFENFFLLTHSKLKALQMVKIFIKICDLFLYTCLVSQRMTHSYEKWTFSLYPISRNLKYRDNLTIVAYRLGLVLHPTIIRHALKFCFVRNVDHNI